MIWLGARPSQERGAVFIPDGSAYDYDKRQDLPGRWSWGWLGREVPPEARGWTDQKLRRRVLARIAEIKSEKSVFYVCGDAHPGYAYRSHEHMGFHVCGICEPKWSGAAYRAWQDFNGSITIEYAGRELRAPWCVDHYIEKHDYRPPDFAIEAMWKGRLVTRAEDYARSIGIEVTTQPPPLVRNISDTARWAAVFRARENQRPDALFRDPFAARLAGERGEEIARNMSHGSKHPWSWVSRTYLFDQFISERVRNGADMVVNLAAGLDARPYRMTLPASLTWIEVDLPDLLDYKEQVLAGEKPVCALERVRLDLAKTPERRALFEQLGRRAKNAVILSEGLLIYLEPQAVGSLATDLAAQASFQHWINDLCSPALLQMFQKSIGKSLTEAGVPFKFGPAEGPAFFEQFGWKAVVAQSLLKTANRLKRLPFYMRPLALFPGTFPRGGKRPWGGVCVLERLSRN